MKYVPACCASAQRAERFLHLRRIRMLIDDISAQDDEIRMLRADPRAKFTQRITVQGSRIMQVTEPDDAQVIIELVIHQLIIGPVMTRALPIRR